MDNDFAVNQDLYEKLGGQRNRYPHAIRMSQKTFDLLIRELEVVALEPQPLGSVLTVAGVTVKIDNDLPCPEFVWEYKEES